MQRSYYLNLAASGLRMPIGTDLLLHEHADSANILIDGVRLGRVVEDAARRFNTPVAMPLMDLRIDKADLLHLLAIPESESDAYHFHELTVEQVTRVKSSLCAPFSGRNHAHIDAVRYVATHTDLLPVGMAIGPFSLMTKLLDDPITAIAIAGMGVSPEDDPVVALAVLCLEMAELTVRRSLRAQIEAGAKAMLICEPAANIVYLSPRQIAAGSDILERFVMKPNLALKRLLDEADVDLIFHNCGELTTGMVQEFATRLRPAILSLGSSRKLWEDAAVVAKDIVLYGNLPSRNFYSDAVMPDTRVEELTLELIDNMRKAAHPHIVGSECDVLHVEEASQTIRRKVDIMMRCSRNQ